MVSGKGYKMSNNNICQMSGLFDVIPMSIVIYRFVEDDFIFIDMNEMALKKEQIIKSELIGKSFSKVFPTLRELGLFDVLVRVYESGEDEELEFESDCWRHFRVSRLENGDVVVICNDVTKEKELKNKVIIDKKKLELLGSIVDNNINEVYIFDANTLYFTYINEAVKNNIGYSFEEMKKLTPVDLKPKYNLQNFEILLKPLVDGKKNSLTFETIHQRKDGTTYHAEIRIQIMNIDNREQFVVIAHDISKRKESQLKLQESEEKFRSITENALMGIFIYQEKFVYVNKAFAKMVGYTKDELYDLRVIDLVEEFSRENMKDIANRRLNGEYFPKTYSDIKVVTKKEQIKIMRASTETIQYNGRDSGMGTIMDVTDIIETKQQLGLLARAVEQMDELVRITDKNGVITYANDALVAHSGYRKVELIGQNTRIFKSGKHNKEFYENMWKIILSKKTYRGVFINRKKDTTLYYEEETITPMMDNDGNIQYFIATSQDITERVLMDEELHRLATIDSLTGVYNRHQTNEEIDIEMARENRYDGSFALLMLDIDHFKDVNDKYGHDVGDYVLKELCVVVSNSIRESDRFGRWGGEEFILILPEINKEAAMKFSDKLRKSISLHSFNGVEKVTVSIGVSIYNNKKTKENLLKNVDMALYKAKEDGRNCIRYFD